MAAESEEVGQPTSAYYDTVPDRLDGRSADGRTTDIYSEQSSNSVELLQASSPLFRGIWISRGSI